MLGTMVPTGLQELASILRVSLPGHCAFCVRSALDFNFDECPSPSGAPGADWTEHRRAEFANGRACARQALGSLGVEDDRVGTRGRLPTWPVGTVGSIAHKGPIAVALVARADAYTSVGVDVDLVVENDRDLLDTICTPSERRDVAASGISTNEAAMRYFVAKEAFYKGQFPVTGRDLEWLDVELAMGPSEFSLRAVDATLFSVESISCVGRLASHSSWAMAAAFFPSSVKYL